MSARAAPWPDFAGQAIREGDIICHPGDGSVGVVTYLPDESHATDAWRVDYGDGHLSRLCLQIGSKGQAVVVGWL